MKQPLTTRLLEGPTSRLVVDCAEIRVTQGPDKGLKIPLELDTLTFGTDPICDVVIHDPTVSSRHAVIEVDERGCRLRDLKSKNGIRVGDQLVYELPVVDGLRFQLGATAFVVKQAGESQEVELGPPRRLGSLVAHSVKMRAVASNLERLAAADITVLLEGETGTGKEVAAQAIHEGSKRARGPFVVFDCGAQTAGLVASELFGHEKGAFTGATETTAGALVSAEGGTLFLDEVGELPLDLQPMLLRAIESRRTRRVGGTEMQHHDVRIIAATNRNLSEEVRAGRFREDLLYRLAVARVRIPPLRERREDIAHLAHRFAEEFGADLTPEILSLLSAYDWPGNVRELRHVVHRAAILPDSELVAPQVLKAPAPLPEARRAATDDFERAYVEMVLAMSQGNVTRAAEIAGVSRQMLTRLVAKHRLRSC